MRNSSPEMTRGLAVIGSVFGIVVVVVVGSGLARSGPGTPAGSDTSATSAPASAPASAAPKGICPPQDVGVKSPGPCVSIDPNAYYRANHLFQDRMTPAPALVRAAVPLAAAAKQQLSALSSRDRQNTQTITKTLVHAGLPRDEVQVQGGGTPPLPIAFGAFTSDGSTPGVCVFGSISSNVVQVQIGGIVQDGGCLPPRGGH